MASIKESNLRIASMLREGKHFSHAMSEEFRLFLLVQGGFDLWDMPICPHCEGLGYWDKEGSAYCPKHGRIAPPVMTFGPYYEAGYAVDRTVHPDAPVMVDREMVSPDKVATVYGGEADLDDKDKVVKAVESEKPL
jgi:hypothetical protein